MVSRLFDLEDAPSLQSDIALKSFLVANSIRRAVYSIVLLIFLILTKREKSKKLQNVQAQQNHNSIQ
jgi:hypothetical protein